MERFKVAPGTVQETLMMPLYGRVYCDEHFPNTFPNKDAVRAAQSVDYDFKKVESSELNMVTWGLRARMLQDAVRDYLQEHPNATIINLGCGLDLSFDAVDNGSCNVKQSREVPTKWKLILSLGIRLGMVKIIEVFFEDGKKGSD